MYVTTDIAPPFPLIFFAPSQNPLFCKQYKEKSYKTEEKTQPQEKQIKVEIFYLVAQVVVA